MNTRFGCDSFEIVAGAVLRFGHLTQREKKKMKQDREENEQDERKRLNNKISTITTKTNCIQTKITKKYNMWPPTPNVTTTVVTQNTNQKKKKKKKNNNNHQKITFMGLVEENTNNLSTSSYR